MIKILQILVVNLPLVFDTSGVLLASGTDLIASKELGKAIVAIQKAGSVSEGLANSDAKISISIGTSKSVSTSHTKQTTHQGSELSAGSVTVRATEGDNTIVGSKINAKEATLEGNNVTLLGTTDTQTNHSDNKSSSWSVGVFVGKSGGSTGLGIEGAASVGKGHSNSDSQVQNHTEINADRLTIKANETTTLKGATANINHLALDTKNLHIESVQDIEKYDSKQTQGGVSASVAIYGSGSSVSAQGSRTKANVDYAQVNQQSGFNIKESSNINVEENTHLKGGVINAQGDKANHSLKTGTLTTESIENRSDIKVSSISAGVSSDMTQMATSAMGAALSALGNTNESERSQTQAAISSNINVQITDSEKQKSLTGKTAEETLQSLNRDVANANSKLEKQDLTKAQERQEMAQTIGQISEDWLQFAVGDKLKEADKKRQEADAIEKENPEKATALRAQAQAIEAEYGLGSNLQMGVRAATAALQGLATGNVNQAAVGAVSPYLNKLIKEQTTNADGSINKEANLIAHAVLGAVEAHITGNNATAGAVGALTAEAAAPLIMQTLYGTEKPENLTDSQKQNVANLSQIAAGLSGGLIGDSTGSFVAGAEIGKQAVENNYLYRQEAEELLNLRLALQRTTDPKEREKIQARIDKLEKLDQDRQEHIKTVCPDFGKSSSACSAAIADAEKAKAGYNGWTDQYQPVSYNSKDNHPYSVVFTQDYDRVNAALVGKDPVTIQKEQFAIDVAKVNGTTPEQEYPWISNGIDLGWLGDFEGWGRSIKGLPKTKWSDFVKKAPVNYPSQTTNLSLSGAENAINAVKLKEQLSNEVLKSQGTKFDELLVSARAEIDGKVYIDTNQNARASMLADPNKPTLIAENIANKAPAKNGVTYPNANMAEAHAEIGAIQQAYEKGATKGKDMVIHVQGRDVCTYCRNDIATAAKKAGLKSVTVHAIDEKEKLHIYTWSSGQTSLKEVKNGK